jgi:5,10-methylenetetrahydromethanopterin reductase
VSLELGLGLQTDKRPGSYARLAQRAEEGGFDVVTAYNDLWFQPALPALLEIAAATTRVRLGPSCLNAYTVHPVELAGQVAALDLASDGRAYLGLAAGAWLDELGLAQRRPVETIAEAWEIVSRLLAGDRSGFVGDVFRIGTGAALAYEPRRTRVPLLVGTWAPKLTVWAREHADELKLGGCANPDLVRLTRERVGPSATRIVAGAVTVVDLDGERARAPARRQVAPYLGVVGALDATFDVDPELLAAIHRLRGDEGAAASLVPDAVLDRFALSGTPAQIAEQAEALFDAGAGRVEFGTPHGLDERAGVDLLVRDVAPRIRRLTDV